MSGKNEYAVKNVGNINPLDRLKEGLARRVGVALLAGSALLGSLSVVEATDALPASAETIVGQCTGPFWGLLTQTTCVHASMGEKNTTNHTQWVGTVEVEQPYEDEFLEVWGENFYHSGDGTSETWTINKWVPSGSGTCGAATDDWGSREIACISISV